MKYFTPILILLLASCYSNNNSSTAESNNPLLKVKMKMTRQEVTAVTGEPTSKEDLGSFVSIDTIHSGIYSNTIKIDSTHLERWSFGNNMEILFTNDSVSGIDTNIVLTQAHLQHLMDSARMANGATQQGVIQQQ